ILTASGGPFRERAFEDMRAVTPQEAIAHPNWSMGAKISVDSATMMNKGLELIEAHHLFQLPPERVDIVVHPQSIVHGAVVYRGGGCPTVLNAANETAVHAFLEGRIGFLDIVDTVERTLEAIPEGALESLGDVYNFDRTAREVAARLSSRRKSTPSTARMDLS